MTRNSACFRFLTSRTESALMCRTRSRLAVGFAFVAAVLAQTGCWGERRADVTGRVTYNGVPLAKPGGEIVFVGPKGTQVVAQIAEDGSYRAVGVTTGLNRVAVYYPNPSFKELKQVAFKPKKGLSPASTDSVPPFLTPLKYASVETSEFSVEVGTATSFDAALTGPQIP